MGETGRSKNKGPFNFGNLEASYEFDTLNLVSVGANLFGGDMLIVLSSCNNDVFVDELKVSDTDIQMSGEGDSIIVEMSTPVWDIYTVNFEKEVLSTRSYLNENDSISYNGVVKGFTVKRIDDRHLSIRVDENLSKEDFKFNITMTIRLMTTTSTPVRMIRLEKTKNLNSDTLYHDDELNGL